MLWSILENEGSELDSAVTQQQSNVITASKRPKLAIDEFLRDAPELAATRICKPRMRVTDQVEDYLRCEIVENTDTLNFWIVRKTSHLELSRFALKVLSMPASE